jgi:N utilization substance protein B
MMAHPERASPAKQSVRTGARLAAVQALYQMEIAGTDVESVIVEFRAHRFGSDIEGAPFPPADEGHFINIVRGVVSNQVDIDRSVNAALAKGWALNRIDSLLRALLRAAVFELIVRPDVPAKVVINEYVDVARSFYDGDEPGFVNGLLDTVAKSRRTDEFNDA